MRHCDNCHGTGESGRGADAGTSPHKACGICHGFGLVFGPASSPPSSPQAENLRAECAALKAKLAEAKALLRETREELHCMAVNSGASIEIGKFQFGHPCDACDEYVDRKGALRKKLDAFLSSVKDA